MLIQNDRKPQMRPAKDKTVKPVSTMGRIRTALVIMLLSYLAVFANAVRLQLLEQDRLVAEGRKRTVRMVTQVAHRGTIFDRNHAQLAFSAPVDALVAEPAKMGAMPTQEQLEELSKLTGQSVESIVDRLAQGSSFVYLKRRIDQETADQIRALNINGIYLREEYERRYAYDGLFSHVIGFTDIDGKGIEGLELAWNEELTGSDGVRVLLRDNRNNFIDSIDSEQTRQVLPGKDLVLALDQRIQLLSLKTLQTTVEYHGAQAASAVVLDARTGEVLAMINYPTYDNNRRGDASGDVRRNRVVTDMIEPGSAMKPFAVAQALDAGKVRPDTVLDTRPYTIQRKPIRDTHYYASLDMRGIIQKSSNVGSSKLSAMFTPKEVYEFYRDLGFGRSTHLGLPAESSGKLHPWQNWQPLDQATMSYGYGLQTSLLQLARSYTVFANDGKILPVSLFKQEVAPLGHQVIRPQTARQVADMMVSVTQEGGTGRLGAVPGYRVAAKTGTARKLVDGRYADNKHMAFFVGFAPAEAPRVIVAVVVDEPSRNGYYGGTVAGPAFREIMGGTLNILGELPDEKPMP